MTDFRATKTVRARKARTCEECCQPIDAGEIYVKDVCKYEDCFDSINYCLGCRDLAKELYTAKANAGLDYEDRGYLWRSLIADAIEFIFYDGAPPEDFPFGSLNTVGGQLRERLLIILMNWR